MLNITIDPNLKQAWPKATLGCVQCKVVTQPSGEKLLAEIAGAESWLQSTLKIEEIKTREQIAQTRACCKALGKDVQRYRNSAEAMHRRILQGKGLYQINNVVDTGNLISIKTGYSLGAYDVEKLEGDILWTATGEGVHYQGIGKDAVNIEFLPVLRDALGYFGNPNSDSTRAMITDKTTEILLCIYSFSGAGGLQQALDDACRELIGKACDKYNLSMRAVSRVRKVARTIADLAGEENIGKAHILEALRYRNLEGNYWK